MTLLGELYANGLGVANDDKKAAEWYKLAAERGDREAMFALAMFRMSGRGGPRDRRRRRGCSPRPPSSAMSPPPTIWRCSISKARCPAGFRARRRTVAQRRRRRQPGGAIRAGDALQGRPRRGEGPGGGRAPARPRGARRATSMPRSNTPSRCSTAPASPRTRAPPPLFPQGRAEGQRGRAEPARADVRDRPRHPGRSGRGRPMAPDRQGRRRQRSVSRRLHAQHEARGPGHGRKQGQALDRAHEPDWPDPLPPGAAPSDQVAPVKP